MGKVGSEFDEFLEKLGKRVSQLRKEAGITQEGMDDGPYAVSVTGVQQIEYAQVDPRLFTIWRIARRLDVPLDRIFKGL